MLQNIPNAMNAINWTTMISVYLKHGCPREVLKAYNAMLELNIAPNEVTYLPVISACTALGDIAEANRIYNSLMNQGIQLTSKIQTSLVHMYARCGDLQQARAIFDKLHGQSAKSVSTWTAMISAYSNQHPTEALNLYTEMKQEAVEPNEVTYLPLLSACSAIGARKKGKQLHQEIINKGIELTLPLLTALVNMYSKCGLLEEASNVYTILRKKYDKVELVSATAMLVALGQHGKGEEAIQFFEDIMKCERKLDSTIFIGILNACNHSRFVKEARHYYKLMKERYQITPELSHDNCMVDTLGRAGNIEEAETFIKNMKLTDIVTWISLLSACRIHGDVACAERAAGNALAIDPNNAAVHVLLANTYAAAGCWKDEERIRQAMVTRGIKKLPEGGDKVHTFLVGGHIP
jgi:pentatricopeptide repeat protein